MSVGFVYRLHWAAPRVRGLVHLDPGAAVVPDLSMRMMHEFPDVAIDHLLPVADCLAEQGWAVTGSGLPVGVISDLERSCRALWHDEALRPAAIGRAGEQQIRPEVRGDHIRWLDDCPPSPAQSAYVEAMAALRHTLNRTLLLGLDSYEAHYALYPPGAGYRRHLDRFKDNPLRTVSVVLYLNSQWQPGDGGELRLHLPQGPVDVAPRAGTLAVFMSDSIVHEVLPAGRDRASLVGWFRRRPDNPLLR